MREKEIRNGHDYAITSLPNKTFLCLYESGFQKRNINYFGIYINNFADAIKELTKRSVEFLYGEVTEYPNSQSVFMSAPSGNEIEISSQFGGQKKVNLDLISRLIFLVSRYSFHQDYLR